MNFHTNKHVVKFLEQEKPQIQPEKHMVVHIKPKKNKVKKTSSIRQQLKC